MEKITLKFDQRKYKANHKELIELSTSKLTELKQVVTTKFAIDLDKTIFNDIALHGGKLVLKQIDKDFKADLKAVKLMAAKDVLQKQYEETKQLLKKVVSEYSQLKILLEYGILDEQANYTFSNDYETKLKESCTKYLTDTKQIELYKQKEIAVKAFEAFRDMIHPDNRIKSVPLQTFGNMMMNPEMLDFKLLAYGAGR